MRNARFSAIFALATLLTGGLAMSAFAEDRTPWRTAADVREGDRGSAIGTVTDVDDARNQLTLMGDGDTTTRFTVLTDSLTTQYNGFGGTINGAPETFSGSKGFSNLRVDDRVEVRGTGRGNGSIGAETVTLLGRVVAAAPTGVGDAKPPQAQVSSPNATSSVTTGTHANRYEGTVRQVNADENRIVVENDQREMITVTGTPTTPVYFHGDTYHLSNIEVGDHVRVEPYAPGSANVQARSIDVLSSVSDSGHSNDRTVGSIAGRVTRIDVKNQSLRIDAGRTVDVAVDARTAKDQAGKNIRVSDFLVGDRITATGTWSGQNTIRAATIRFGQDSDNGGPGAPLRSGSRTTSPPAHATNDYVSIVVYGTVQESLKSSPVIVVKDKDLDRTVRIMVSEDFAVRTRTGSYTTADTLKNGDRIVVKTYRDSFGNYIAQTIRMQDPKAGERP